MKWSDLYGYSKCPNCNKYTISYKQKLQLVDYRFTHKCKKCGEYIQLPGWHAVLCIFETIMLMVLGIKFEFNIYQAIICCMGGWLFVEFVQVPFVPIRA